MRWLADALNDFWPLLYFGFLCCGYRGLMWFWKRA